MAGPIEQFEIKPLLELAAGGIDLDFTNPSACMVLTVVLASGLLLIGTAKRSLVPGRWQPVSEHLFESVTKTLRENAGLQGMRFFPLVFSLFTFILVANLIGMLAFAFKITSHIIVTLALALIVFGTATIYGLVNGFGSPC
jgi:F-type H+-transporting ATPase subunit a